MTSGASEGVVMRPGMRPPEPGQLRYLGLFHVGSGPSGRIVGLVEISADGRAPSDSPERT